nr:hypothetical protein [Listeria monocytogenes]
MAGRKSKYESHVRPYLADIIKWVKMGEPQYIICKKLGINKATFCEYKNKYPELNEAIKKGSQFLDYEVIESLAKRAIGYDYEETKSIIEKLADGREKRKIEKTVKHIPPDTGAIALYMKNRRLLQSLDEEVKSKQIKLIQVQTEKVKAEIKNGEKPGGTTTIIMSNVDEMQAYLDKKAGGTDERDDTQTTN